ncbi:hypothetical protein C4K14_6508 [Pseudomonas chlororaphis subsp. aureofaciens]|uniref:hypothetical protein n=1 Tax=Pseudomonas chlororaphis TaxID=587753 RepID=UPI000F572720|nr:hypothetical protein [Pseudomonas chlororaphis]AZD89287.1 hypothetical protein C4K14_6508 [Pseudomonas chlororaphis subsp. aureofaciens]
MHKIFTVLAILLLTISILSALLGLAGIAGGASGSGGISDSVDVAFLVAKWLLALSLLSGVLAIAWPRSG